MKDDWIKALAKELKQEYNLAGNYCRLLAIIRRHAKPVTDRIAELEGELKREIDGAVEYHALLSEHLTDSVNAGLALKKELAEAQELNLRLTDKIWELEKECKHTQKGGQNETQDD